LHAGEVPLWNPLLGHGFPALGESQTGVFYPFHLLLYRYLALNTAYHANFLLHYVLAFGFACHYVRRLGYSVLESILAALIFVYGWFPVRSCLEWSIVTGAWIPLAFWGVERFVVEARPRALFATQLAIIMQLLAGHFNLAFVTLVGLAIYAPMRLLAEQRPWKYVLRQLFRLAAVSLLACGVAAIQLVPSWELKSRSQRATAAFAEQQVGYGAIPWPYLSQIIQPWRIYPRVNEPAFERDQLGRNNTNKVEAHLYFGFVPLALAAIGVVTAGFRRLIEKASADDRPIWAWLVIGALSLTLALGMWIPLAVHLPGFGYFTGPGRYGVLIQLAVAVLASAGARSIHEWVTALSQGSPRLTWAVTWASCIGIALLTETWITWSGGAEAFLRSFFPVREGWCTVGQCGLWFLVAWVLVAIVVALVRRPASILTLTAILLTWIDVSLVAQFVQYAEIRPESPIQLREFSPVRTFLLHQSPPARLLARNQNAISLSGVSTVPVYLGIGPREYFGGALQLPREFHWDAPLDRKTQHWLRWAGVTHVLSFEPMSDEELDLIWLGYDPLLHGLLGRPVEQPLWLYAVRDARARCYWVSAADARAALDDGVEEPIRTTPVPDIRVAANEVAISVHCDEAGVVVLTELMYPGWDVLIDGRWSEPIGNSVFRAVRVDSGAHEICWRYRPGSLKVGVMLSLGALIGTALFFRHRPRTEPLIA
jgi:hypothetical protein